MKKTILLLIILFGSLVSHAVDLGIPLELEKNPQTGKDQLGVHFFYNESHLVRPFHFFWNLISHLKISQQQLTALQLKWNFFDARTNIYLENWSQPSDFQNSTDDCGVFT